MDEARSLTYSINVQADTAQAESDLRSIVGSIGGLRDRTVEINADTSQAGSNIRDITGRIGDLNTQASSVGSAFRRSFLDSVDSGNSFSSSLRSGVGGALSYVGDRAEEFRNRVVTGAQSIRDGFAHPIETIKNGLGNALQGAKDRFIEMARGAEQAEGATDEVGDTASDTRKEVDNLGDSAEKTGGKFEGFGKVLKGVGVALVATTTAVAAIGGAAIKAGSEYESAFAQVATIMDTSQMSTDDMSASIKALSSEMGIAATELSGTVYNAISATGDTANAVSLAGQASKLATAGFTETSSALAVLTTAMNAYGLSADEASNISDSLIMVQNLGVTTVAELSSNMGKAIASASAYGVNLTNLESAYVSITKAGISTAEGTTYISAMLQELGDSGSDVAGILKEKTGKSFDQLMAEGNSLGDVLGILNDSVNGDSTALMNLWSTATAGKASAAIVGQGLDTFNENLIAIGNSAGATDEAFGVMADTLEHKTEVFKTVGTNLLSSIYEGMSGKLGDIMDFANSSMTELASAFEEGGVPALIGAFGHVLSEGLNFVIGMLPDVIDAGTQLLGALGQGILDNLPTLVGAAAQIIVTLASGIGSNLPTLIPSVIEALTLTVSTIIDNLPLILDAGMQLIDGLAQGILAAIPLLVEQLPELILQIIGFLSENLPTIIDQGAQIILSLGMGLINAIPQLVAQLPSIITAFVGFVTENLPTIIETGINLLVQLGIGLIQAIPQLVAQLPQIITAIVGGFAQLPGMMLDIGKNIVSGIWDGITAMGSWIKEKVSGFFGGIVDGVKGLLGIHSPSTVFAGIGDNMAAGLGKGFETTMGGVTKNIEDSIPTEFDLPTANAPDVTYGVTPVVGDFDPGTISDVTYSVNPIMGAINTPSVADVTYGVTPVVGDFDPVDTSVTANSDTDGQTDDNPPPPEPDGDGTPPISFTFAPVLNIEVSGNADERTVENLKSSLRDTVRELFEEYKEEELERMALKNQYAFG